MKQVSRVKKILLLTLETFSATGGIQKMSRTMAYVLQQITNKKGWELNLFSGYDNNKDLDINYINPCQFKGFNKNRTKFTWEAAVKGSKSDVLILTHINLAFIAWLIKIFNPNCKVWLMAHGIEVWRPLGFFKKKLLCNCNKIICVSNFTQHRLVDLHNVNPGKCVVLNNILDPHIKLPNDFFKPVNLLKRYRIKKENKVLFTLTRMDSAEQYKGYDQVIKAIGILKLQFPKIIYILAGKHDAKEAARVNELICRNNVREEVIVTGFINEKDLKDYFLLADMFVLPSKKEGFGMVLIEALAYGLPVICGNKDGSVDAIRNGELGKAINPDSADELVKSITNNLTAPLTISDRKHLQERCLKYFSADTYKTALEEMLTT